MPDPTTPSRPVAAAGRAENSVVASRQVCNNPRIFEETVGLEVWRKPFDRERGEADLHIDVVFGAGGRVGSGQDPVRFRLSLKRAEIHVIKDRGGRLEIVRGSIYRPPSATATSTTVTEKSTAVEAGAGLKISQNSVTGGAGADAKASITSKNRTEQTRELVPMEVMPWPRHLEGRYTFRIAPAIGACLEGRPWLATTPLMKLRDKSSYRTKGDAPEVSIQIHCLREDLLIEDIELISRPGWWNKLTRNKQLIVEQYIKDELSKLSWECGDLADKFARIVLADAVPEVV